MTTTPSPDGRGELAASFIVERSAAADALVGRYRDATAPFLADRGKRMPDLLGGSVLFLASGWVFLLTAAHVLDAFGEDTILLSTPPGFTTVRQWPALRDDGSDAAVVQVPPEVVTDTMVEGAVTLGDLDLARDRAGEWFALLGSPPKLFKVVTGTNTRMRAGCWTGFAAANDDYHARGRSPMRDLVLEYDPDGAYDERGQKRRSILFKGCSGSGMWRLPQEHRHEVSGRPGLLAAIFTDYSQNRLIGTRVSVHLQLIREMHPFILPHDL